MSCCDEKTNAKLLAKSTVKLIAAVVLIDQDERILIAQRPQNKDMAGLWEFPGGKPESGETPEAALVRELKEEVDIDTCAGCMIPLTFASHSYDNFHLLMPLYACRNWKGFTTPLEGQELKWIKKFELKNYNMPEANNFLKDFLIKNL